MLQGGSETLTGELSVTVPDGDGVPSRVSTSPREPCHVMAGRPTAVRLLCRLGRVNSSLTAEFHVGGQVVTRRTFKTAPLADAEHFLPGMEFQDLIVTVGPGHCGGRGGQARRRRARAPARGRHTSMILSACPRTGAVTRASTRSSSPPARPEIYRKLSAHAAQRQALEEWVRMGGRLYCVWARRPRKSLLPTRRCGCLLPAGSRRCRGVRPGLRELLRQPCGRAAGRQLKAPLRVPQLADVQGTVEAHEATCRCDSHGTRLWPNHLPGCRPRSAALERLARLSLAPGQALDMPTGHAEESEESAAMMHYGYSDLSGQLRSALDRFGGVGLAPFWLVAALIVVYLC